MGGGSTQHHNEGLDIDMGAAAQEETTEDVPMGYIGVMEPSLDDTISEMTLMARGSSGKTHQREARSVCRKFAGNATVS